MTAQGLDAAYIQLIGSPAIYGDNLEDSVAVILRQCAQDLSVGRASLWLMSEDDRLLECASLYLAAEDRFESGGVLEADMFPGYFNALLNERVVAAVDALQDPRTAELSDSYLQVLDVHSLLDAAIRHTRSEGQIQGLLCFEALAQQRRWTVEEQMYVASVADLLSQRLVSTELMKSEAKYRSLFDSADLGIILFDGMHFTDANPAACRMFGAAEGGLAGLTPLDVSPETQPNGQSSQEKAMAHIDACLEGVTQNFEWVHARLDGVDFLAEVTLNAVNISGTPTLFALIRDIDDQKEAQKLAAAAQEKLEYRAAHDSLTGLLNREQLHLHVGRMIDDVQDASREIALILFDLNRFKEINDTLGHSTGDRVLIDIANLLSGQVGATGGTLFRLGGDEFVAVFDSSTCQVPFEELTGLLKRCLDRTIVLDDVAVSVGASVGGALFPIDGQNSHDLLRCADVAMYHSKSNEGTSPWYEQRNDVNDKHRLSMLAGLRDAIRDDELVLHFQPRIHIATGRLTGCEALVRWQHHELGLIPPGSFLPLAEMSELIHPLTVWVVRAAFEQIKRLRAMGHFVPVAVNLSPRNLPDTQLFDLIEELLLVDSIDPRLLEVEITESALIKQPELALQNLLRLEKLGVSIAIDDFGTGYSSLALLKRVPLDTIKIDQTFVSDLSEGGSDEVIVGWTVSLAHNFSATVVAEGVEEQATLDVLRGLNCDEAQGFLIARPMPASAFEEWVLQYDPADFADPNVLAGTRLKR